MNDVTFKDVQRHLANLLEEVRAVPVDRIPTTEETLPIALELTYTALAMKPAHTPAAMLIVRRYCVMVGLDPEEVREFALLRIAEVCS